ncbi:unnamed protein product [Closterium sp. NIES-53]
MLLPRGSTAPAPPAPAPPAPVPPTPAPPAPVPPAPAPPAPVPSTPAPPAPAPPAPEPPALVAPGSVGSPALAPPTLPVPAAPVPLVRAPLGPAAAVPLVPPALAPPAPPAPPALVAPLQRRARRTSHSRSCYGDSLGEAPAGRPDKAAPRGSAPPDSAPSDLAPPGSTPSGSAPPSSTPAGSAPPGSSPPGSAPPDPAPSDSATPGSAPSDAAPRAAAEPTATSTGVTQDRKVLAEPLAKLETDYADPRDQYINDLNLDAQGKNRGVPRVVVNNQQNVALAALSTCWCNPDFESNSAFSLVPELVDLPARNRLDYVASLVTESDSVFPPSVEGEPALSSDVLEDRELELECLAAALPRFASMLLCPEGDPDAPEIPTPRSYAEAIMGPYSSQWQTAMDEEMASWKSTGTYIDVGSPSRANIVDGMWIFSVKRPPGSPPAFKWSLRRPVYGLREAPREWLDILKTTLAAIGFAPSTSDPSLFLRSDTILPPFYILVYVDDLVFATANTQALALVKAELQERPTCTDLGELRIYLGLQITRDRARCTITLTQSHMVHQVLQRFGFQFSSPQPTPLSTGHSLSDPPSDEFVEPSGPYPELVGCLMYMMTCTRRDLAYPLSLLARYVATGRHRKVHWDAAKRVLRYLCSTSGMGLVLGGRGSVVLTGHSDASWADDQATQRLSQCYTFSIGSDSVSWRSSRSSSVLGSSCEAEIYAGAMAAQELRWLTYLLTDLGERPCSPPVLYVDNKAMLALCREQRLEHKTKRIALRYYFACELQQRRQLRLSYVASRANTADVFAKALGFGDHQHCVVSLRSTLRFATANTQALALMKAELQERHTCTDLGELRSYLGLQITRDRARCTITLTHSHMVHQVLQRFGFQFSSPQPTPLSTGHSLSAPPSDEFVEPGGPYPELVGCLIYMMTCTRRDLAYPLSLLARYVAPGDSALVTGLHLQYWL